MNDRLHQAFAAVKAEQELTEKTRQAIARRTKGYKAQPRSAGWAVAAACCLLLLVLGGVGGKLFFTPVSAISVDINPSLELNVNCFDRVISVEGYNEDGQALAQELNLVFAKYPQALSALVSHELVQACLKDGKDLSVYVACDDPQRGREMLGQVKACVGKGRNVNCHAGNLAQSHSAHSVGLSCGKYHAFLELQGLDATFTVEEAREMTVREILQRIEEISGKPATANGHGHGKGHGGKHGMQRE